MEHEQQDASMQRCQHQCTCLYREWECVGVAVVATTTSHSMYEDYEEEELSSGWCSVDMSSPCHAMP